MRETHLKSTLKSTKKEKSSLNFVLTVRPANKKSWTHTPWEIQSWENLSGITQFAEVKTIEKSWSLNKVVSLPVQGEVCGHGKYFLQCWGGSWSMFKCERKKQKQTKSCLTKEKWENKGNWHTQKETSDRNLKCFGSQLTESREKRNKEQFF